MGIYSSKWTLKSNCSIPKENNHWNFNEKCIEPFDQIEGKNIIFTIFNLPIQEQDRMLDYSSLLTNFGEILVFYREVFHVSCQFLGILSFSPTIVKEIFFYYVFFFF